LDILLSDGVKRDKNLDFEEVGEDIASKEEIKQHL